MKSLQDCASLRVASNVTNGTFFRNIRTWNYLKQRLTSQKTRTSMSTLSKPQMSQSLISSPWECEKWCVLLLWRVHTRGAQCHSTHKQHSQRIAVTTWGRVTIQIITCWLSCLTAHRPIINAVQTDKCNTNTLKKNSSRKHDTHNKMRSTKFWTNDLM